MLMDACGCQRLDSAQLRRLAPALMARRRSDADVAQVQRQHLRQVDRLAGSYNRELQRRIKRLQQELMRAFKQTASARLDDEEEGLTNEQRNQLMLALALFIPAWRQAEEPSEPKLTDLFNRADRLTTRTARRTVAKVVPGRGMRDFLLELPAADPRRMREDFIRANVDLIKSIDTRYFADIARVVDEAYANGRDWKWLSAEFQQRYDVSKSRGQLLARDQLGKLTGQLTAARHLELGIDRFQWLTSEDERVRRTHERLAGQIFSYDDPPAVGLPGMDFQCRCSPRPVLDEAHAAQLRKEAAARSARTSERLAGSPIVTGEIVPIASRRIGQRRVEEFRGQFRKVA